MITRSQTVTSIFLACLVLMFACVIVLGTPLKERSLLVIPGATNVHWENDDMRVSYDLEVTYPALGLLKGFGVRLKGWEKLDKDFMNGGPISDRLGWFSYTEHLDKSEVKVKQWTEEWMSSSGDILWYTLQYRSAISDPPQQHRLRVFAAYVTPVQAEAMRQQENRLNATSSSVDTKTDAGGDSDSFMLIWAAQQGQYKTAYDLLRSGANPDVSDESGFTALMAASAYGQPKLVNLLLSKGATVNLRDKQGLTALGFAVLRDPKGSNEIIESLIRDGADVNLRYGGKSLIQIARDSGGQEMVEILRKAGAKD